jgi:D-arabinose 1-dehydrogenase-like Zn-dependent alcohol dehydrogenase
VFNSALFSCSTLLSPHGNLSVNSHSDIHVGLGELQTDRLPYILGHEGVGIVVKLGLKAASNIRLGDRVAIGNINSACSACTECHEGRENHCKTYKQSGANVHGAYAEYATIHSRYAIKIPDGIPFPIAAPVACAGHTVYSGVRELKDVRPGSWVAVIGVGGLGHLAVQYAVAMGFRVIASKCFGLDNHQKRCLPRVSSSRHGQRQIGASQASRSRRDLFRCRSQAR